MFSTIDRQQTGCISLASFQELLGTVLNKDLSSDTRLFNDILSTIGKVSYSEPILQNMRIHTTLGNLLYYSFFISVSKSYIINILWS